MISVVVKIAKTVKVVTPNRLGQFSSVLRKELEWNLVGGVSGTAEKGGKRHDDAVKSNWQWLLSEFTALVYLLSLGSYSILTSKQRARSGGSYASTNLAFDDGMFVLSLCLSLYLSTKKFNAWFYKPMDCASEGLW